MVYQVNQTNKMVTNNQNFNVTYKGVTYSVSLNTTKSELYVDGSYLCSFEYNGINWRDEQHLIDEIYDCVGGWVEGYETYSLRTNKMVTNNQKINEVFNNIFELQFGYKPLTQNNGKLLKEGDESIINLKKLQLVGYVPYIVNEFENNPKPSFVNAVRVKGTAKETSCGSLRTLYKRIGFIDSVNGKMVKGKNYDKFLTTKWDWFFHYGTKVLIVGQEYPKDYITALTNNHNWGGWMYKKVSPETQIFTGIK